jgi:hypothetical protein
MEGWDMEGQDMEGWDMTRRELLASLAALPAAALLGKTAAAQQADDAFGQYGRRFLTAEERERFHLEMQNAESEQEREEIRERHRDVIRNRAQQEGVTLPEDFGRAGGMGGGMGGQGTGGGMGGGTGGGMGGGGQGMGN